MGQITASNLTKLITAAEQAVDFAGTGQYRGLRLVQYLAGVGIDFTLTEPVFAHRTLHLTAPVQEDELPLEHAERS